MRINRPFDIDMLNHTILRHYSVTANSSDTYTIIVGPVTSQIRYFYILNSDYNVKLSSCRRKELL